MQQVGASRQGASVAAAGAPASACRAPRISRAQPRRPAVAAAAQASKSGTQQQQQQQQQQGSADEQGPVPLHRRVALAALAAASVASMAGAPMEALAVSGGGGISNPLSGADFSNRDIAKEKRSFTKAIIRKTNFSNSNLTGVSLFGSIAPNSNFSNANLTMALMDSGDFEGSDFTNANLTAAYVANSQFQGVNITNTDWTDVSLLPAQQKYLCSIASGTNPTTGNDTRESLGCP